MQKIQFCLISLNENPYFFARGRKFQNHIIFWLYIVLQSDCNLMRCRIGMFLFLRFDEKFSLIGHLKGKTEQGIQIRLRNLLKWTLCVKNDVIRNNLSVPDIICWTKNQTTNLCKKYYHTEQIVLIRQHNILIITSFGTKLDLLPPSLNLRY